MKMNGLPGKIVVVQTLRPEFGSPAHMCTQYPAQIMACIPKSSIELGAMCVKAERPLELTCQIL